MTIQPHQFSLVPRDGLPRSSRFPLGGSADPVPSGLGLVEGKGLVQGLTSGGFQIESVIGTFSDGEEITINGTGFGVKSPVKPYLWAPFIDSSAPSQLGLITAWSAIENMNFVSGEGFGGKGALKATDSSGIWTAGVLSDFAWNDYSRNIYVFRREKLNFDVSEINWKIIRFWPGDGGVSPNFYVGTGGSGGMSAEGISCSNCGSYPFTDVSKARGTPGEWRTDEFIIKSNSNSASSDGTFDYFVDGGLVARSPYTTYDSFYFKLRSDDSQSGEMRQIYPVHGVQANVTLLENYRYWVDEVYVDTTWARIMIGNASVFSNCTKKEIQIPVLWNESQIKVNFHLGAFSDSAGAWLYVVNSENEVSNGVPIELGGQ